MSESLSTLFGDYLIQAPRPWMTSKQPSSQRVFPCMTMARSTGNAGVIDLLDTNAISDLMRADARMENWISALGRADRVVTCTIVRGAIHFETARLPEGRRRAEEDDAGLQFLNAFRCEPIPQLAGDDYANLKLTRKQRGLTLGENDLWVAAGAKLVTRDSDFAGIPGLSVVAPE